MVYANVIGKVPDVLVFVARRGAHLRTAAHATYRDVMLIGMVVMPAARHVEIRCAQGVAARQATQH